MTTRLRSLAENLFPFLVWGRTYRAETLAKDSIAALIMVVLLIPQALGYAIVAGVPPHVGLYTCLLPPVLYAVFGTSMAMSVGTTALASILTAMAAGAIAAQGSPEYIAAAILLATIAGLVLIALGILRLGFLTNFLSHPVLSGFVSGSVITIAASQVKYLLNIPGKSGDFLEIVESLVPHLRETHMPTLILSLACLAVLFALRMRFKWLLQKLGMAEKKAKILAGGGPFLVAVVSILVVGHFRLDLSGIKVIGDIPKGLPSFVLPSFDLHLWKELVGPATLIAVVVLVESLSIAKAFAAKRREKISPDKELIALGAASMGAAITGGYPIAGSFSRSAVSFDAGTATPMAGVLTAMGIAVVISFGASALFYLPLALLSAMIFLAVLSLVDFHIFKEAWTYSKRDFMAVVATLGTTLVSGVEHGLMVGIGLSMFLHIYNTSRPNSPVVGLIPGTQHFRSVTRNKTLTCPSILSLRVDESLYFSNANFLEEVVNREIAHHPEAKHLVLKCSAVNHIDLSALEGLKTINRTLKEMGILLHLSEVKAPVMDRLKKSDLLETLSGKVFLSHYQAVTTLEPSEAWRK